ncbi:MAG: hypothetical protein ACRCXZ_00955 [Patescibacteria group bacterium]
MINVKKLSKSEIVGFYELTLIINKAEICIKFKKSRSVFLGGIDLNFNNYISILENDFGLFINKELRDFLYYSIGAFTVINPLNNKTMDFKLNEKDRRAIPFNNNFNYGNIPIEFINLLNPGDANKNLNDLVYETYSKLYVDIEDGITTPPKKCLSFCEFNSDCFILINCNLKSEDFGKIFIYDLNYTYDNSEKSNVFKISDSLEDFLSSFVDADYEEYN